MYNRLFNIDDKQQKKKGSYFLYSPSLPSLLKLQKTHNLVLLPPNVIRALIPTVASTLKNAVLTLKPVKNPWLLRHTNH